MSEENREDNDPLAHQQLIKDVQAILDTLEGKRFFRWFFLVYPYVREVYARNADTQYLAGKVAVARGVYEVLSQASPDLMVPSLLREDYAYGEVARS